jgi:hypothetical protein
MLDTDQSITTLICDMCGSYGEKDAEGPFKHGSLHIRGPLRFSPTGIEGLGDRSRSYDLCRRCTAFIDRTTESHKPAILAHWSTA